MRLISNSGIDRVSEDLRGALKAGVQLDVASSAFSLFAFEAMTAGLSTVKSCRLVLPGAGVSTEGLLGSAACRPFRNRLQSRWLARLCVEWIKKYAAIRFSPHGLPQSLILTGPKDDWAVSGACAFTTEGLGITPGERFGLIHRAESPEEVALLRQWFDSVWQALPEGGAAREQFLQHLQSMAEPQPPSLVYGLILQHLLGSQGKALDEEEVVRTATGIRETLVWRKLYRFQRDGVLGAIEKLEKLGGCIIADSVGLGKTFEALAVIKYYELRNDRVLVLCPKRLRDNWTVYTANDRRNSLAADRFNYDVLNHTDLSRENGTSGDIDLSHVNWGNYDLVVIDESHNFRNKLTHKDKESRYDKLMRRIIQEGVKTKVLMLSATPVNNRLADLKNQIAFVTEGQDGALAAHGIPSIEVTSRHAQKQFNAWLTLPEAERKPSKLLDMLGLDYFKLLDLLTIARSRKHIEKYYGTQETGRFPERLKPINVKSDVDRAGEFSSIREINNEIRRLNLAAYAPLRYVLPAKQAAYDAKYSTKVEGGNREFRQVDREENLVHLLRINVLKRMESAVSSFALTLGRQLTDVKATLARIDRHAPDIEEIDIADVDVDDPMFESLLVGSKVKVLLQDVDLVRWRQELEEDRDRLTTLLEAAQRVGAARDAKLEALRNAIRQKVENPLNPGNRKVIVFTAFADTAKYLFEHLAPWAHQELGIQTAMVTGTGGNKTTLTKLRADQNTILSAFSPRSKERPESMAAEGDLDLLIATDCISEGQNLQDCDTLINYDIHWNPVRIIQRFGRIDRIGSINKSIQLINFWPNVELEEYIKLEQRVSGRMVLLDLSATGEENLIEQQSGDQMNDLEYRRKQLLQLQEAVIDMEDLSTGLSITDMTLTDFRIDLASLQKAHAARLPQMPLGTLGVVQAKGEVPPGVIYCLQAAGEAALKAQDPGYPLAPHYLVHVGADGAVLLTYTQAREVLDRLKTLCSGQDLPNLEAWARFDKATRNGRDMDQAQDLLAKAVASITGKREERAVASLFTPGGTHALRGEFAGTHDFEVVAFVVVEGTEGGL